MEECKAELATLESLDSGAVYSLALKTHVGFSIDTFRYFAGWADKIEVRTTGWKWRAGTALGLFVQNCVAPPPYRAK